MFLLFLLYLLCSFFLSNISPLTYTLHLTSSVFRFASLEIYNNRIFFSILFFLTTTVNLLSFLLFYPTLSLTPNKHFLFALYITCMMMAIKRTFILAQSHLYVLKSNYSLFALALSLSLSLSFSVCTHNTVNERTFFTMQALVSAKLQCQPHEHKEMFSPLGSYIHWHQGIVQLLIYFSFKCLIARKTAS